MLKHFYQTETEIPENLRGAYVAKNGRFELLDLEASHPLILKRDELLSKEQAAKTLKTEHAANIAKIQTLEAEKTALAAKVLPEGFKAVSAAVAELGETALANGLGKDEIPTIKTEFTKLKTEKESRDKHDFLTQVAAHESVNFAPDAFATLAVQHNLNIQKVTETVDGKAQDKFVVVEKHENGEVKTTLTDFVKNSAAFKPFLPALAPQKEQESGFSFGKQTKDDGNATGNFYDAQRKQVQDAEKSKTPYQNVSLADAFNNSVAAS